jgi:hydrogenase maturation protease
LRTIVIGIGNLLRCDDGAGIHVISRLEELKLPIDILDVAMGSVEILEAMKGYDEAYIVDAIESGGKPGTVSLVNLTEGAPPSISYSHGVNLATTLLLGRHLYGDQLPKKITLIAIEAADTLTLSERCTPDVEQAIDRVVEEILSHQHPLPS